MRIRRMLQRSQERDDSANFLDAWFGAEHRLGEGFFDGGAEILLPAVPRPGCGSLDAVKTRRQLGIAVGVVVECVEGEAARVAVHVAGIAAEPLIVRAARIVKKRFPLSSQRRMLGT